MRAIASMTCLGLTLAIAALRPPTALGQVPPPPDPAAIWTFQWENAAITTSNLSDRYYTNGLRLGWTSREGGAPDFLESFGQAVWGDGQQRISVDISQQIYTPADTEASDPPLDDRPYAGALLGTVSLIHDGERARSVLAVGLGLIGPAALGEEVQNGFHSLIGQNRNNGWDTQLHNQPILQFNGERTWRLPIAAVGDLDTDALPAVALGAGNLRIYAQAGVTFRVGQGLDSDYGVARLRPGLTGTDAYRPTRDFAWYLFVGADGQAVAYDVTLNGNLWESSRSVPVVPLVGEMQAGLAVLFSGVRLTYTQVFQTQEFRHQKGGLHQLGSLALSVRF